MIRSIMPITICVCGVSPQMCNLGCNNYFSCLWMLFFGNEPFCAVVTNMAGEQILTKHYFCAALWHERNGVG